MQSDDNQNRTCSIRETDREGNPNLCCCYFMDADGNIDDPCYVPADECCSDADSPSAHPHH